MRGVVNARWNRRTGRTELGERIAWRQSGFLNSKKARLGLRGQAGSGQRAAGYASLAPCGKVIIPQGRLLADDDPPPLHLSSTTTHRPVLAKPRLGIPPHGPHDASPDPRYICTP